MRLYNIVPTRPIHFSFSMQIHPLSRQDIKNLFPYGDEFYDQNCRAWYFSSQSHVLILGPTLLAS